jgi:uncharacterized protein (DUF1778 family)
MTVEYNIETPKRTRSSIRLHIKVTKFQKEQIRLAAKRNNQTISDYCRKALNLEIQS